MTAGDGQELDLGLPVRSRAEFGGAISSVQNPLTRTWVRLTEPFLPQTQDEFDLFRRWTAAILRAGWDATKELTPVGWDPEVLDVRPFTQWLDSERRKQAGGAP